MISLETLFDSDLIKLYSEIERSDVKNDAVLAAIAIAARRELARRTTGENTPVALDLPMLSELEALSAATGVTTMYEMLTADARIKEFFRAVATALIKMSGVARTAESLPLQ